MDGDDDRDQEMKAKQKRYADWVASLKPGDSICVEIGSYGIGKRNIVKVVAKVTKEHGGTIYIAESETHDARRWRFDMTGYERRKGSDRTYRGRDSLVELTPEKLEEIEHYNLADSVDLFFRVGYDAAGHSLTLAELRIINPILEAARAREKKETE